MRHVLWQLFQAKLQHGVVIVTQFKKKRRHYQTIAILFLIKAFRSEIKNLCSLKSVVRIILRKKYQYILPLIIVACILAQQISIFSITIFLTQPHYSKALVIDQVTQFVGQIVLIFWVRSSTFVGLGCVHLLGQVVFIFLLGCLIFLGQIIFNFWFRSYSFFGLGHLHFLGYVIFIFFGEIVSHN